MSQTGGLHGITERLDALYEFDREPVTEDKLQSGWRFAALFAGERVAGTEFVIGAMFVLHGVSARDLIWGLLLGNLLAVLSWTLICAPIGVRVRLTLYWYLRKVGGPGITFIYNIANALLYCILAGAMISVAATAVGLAFDVNTPGLNEMWPAGPGWVAIVLVVGAVVTLLAALGGDPGGGRGDHGLRVLSADLHAPAGLRGHLRADPDAHRRGGVGGALADPDVGHRAAPGRVAGLVRVVCGPGHVGPGPGGVS